MNRQAFAADLDRYDTTFRNLDAIKRGRDEDGSTFLYLDTNKIPGPVLRSYRNLISYGYATGLLS